MNIVHKLPLLVLLFGALTVGCAVLGNNTPKKNSPSSLISTPATYYSTAKARYLGTKYKENLERLIERVVRDPKTTTLQFANNISSVGGIGFFTHSATQTPDERYLEIVLVTPETFEIKGAQSEKVERLFSAYGQALLGILVNEPDIFRDSELSGYGLNLAWRNVTAGTTGNRVSMERAILYFSKDRVRGFLRHEFSQTDLLSDAVIFSVEEDGPLQLVSYKPQEVRPDFRPTIREDNLASAQSSAKTAAVGAEKPAGTDANRRMTEKANTTTVASAKKDSGPAPAANEAAESTAETQRQTVAKQQSAEAIAKATPTAVAPLVSAQSSAPPVVEPVVAQQPASAPIVNSQSNATTKVELHPEPKPLPPQPVVETIRNNDSSRAPAPAGVAEGSREPKKSTNAREFKPSEANALPASTIKPVPALPLPVVQSSVVPAPIPAELESLSAVNKSSTESTVAAVKAPIQQAKTSSSELTKTAEPAVEPQKDSIVTEAKRREATAPPARAATRVLPEVKPAVALAPTPAKVESLPAAIKHPTETAVTAEAQPSPSPVMKTAEPVVQTLPVASKAAVEPPAAALKSVEPANISPVREITAEELAGEQIALLKKKPVESKPENKPIMKSTPKALEGFIVQLAFNDKEKALRWADDMERRGYAISITEAGAEGRLRVRLGNFAQRDDAERQLRTFKQEGLNGIIINLPQGFQPEARSWMP